MYFIMKSCLHTVWPPTLDVSSIDEAGTEDGNVIIKIDLRVPTPPGKSWIFYCKFQDLESPGKSFWSWKTPGN